MKKLLVSGAITSFLLPGLVFAAYSSVTLTTNVDLSVNSITLDVLGDDAVIESIQVESGNFSATLQAGSSLKVSPATNNKLVYDILYAGTAAPSIDYVCTSATSTLQISASSASASTTITVTPQTALCAAATATASSGTSRSDERGGGGGGTTVAVVANPVAVAATTATKEDRIQSIMQAIAALQAQMQTLTGAPAAQVSAISGKITANLGTSSRGASVKTLQQFLNTHGFAVASSGAGSPGKETETFGSRTVKAVQKFQEKYNIAKPGVPGYGTVGPKTRAKINELSAQ